MRRWNHVSRKIAALALGLLSLGVAARASELRLEPERFAVTPGATLTLALTLAATDEGSNAERALTPERVARVVGRADGAIVTVASAQAEGGALRLSATLPRPAVAVFGVELKPQLFEREAHTVERTLRQIHASAELRAVWAAMPEPRRWRERQVRHAKTFVRVGEPRESDRDWAGPLGLELEIVPESDPAALRAGDELRVRVLRAGAPLAGFVVAFISAGETHEHVTVTDEAGRAAAPLEVAGGWLVHGTDLRRAASGEREWDSDLTTLTIQVREATVAPLSK